MEENKNKTEICAYQSNGEEVKLTFADVRNRLVKGGAEVTDAEIINFAAICKYNALNPFLGEAYLVKYAGKGGGVQMIVSKEAYFKRAEACEEYEGIQSGVIVKHNDEYEELEGCFVPDNATLVGAWAKVYRKDRKFPVVAKVNLAEYNKGNQIWNEKKSTMIAKIAKVQALREAFPSKLGALYTEGEGTMDTEVIEDKKSQGTKKVKLEGDFVEFKESTQEPF